MNPMTNTEVREKKFAPHRIRVLERRVGGEMLVTRPE
jgi:hypothetical protein